MTVAPVTKALIPCGGKGTRMSPLTGGGAKELLPIGGVPLVLRVMEECAASGIDEVLVVSAPGKFDLEDAVRAAAGSPGQWGVVWRRFRKHKLAVFSSVLLILVFIMSLLATWLWHRC